MNQANRAWISDALRDLEIFGGRQFGNRPQRPWDESLLPASGPCVLVVDGYGTQSTQRPLWGGTIIYPWMTVLTPLVQRAFPSAAIRGFSYSAAGFHYRSGHTSRQDLLTAIPTLFADYTPSTAVPIIYLAFSLGGLVTLIGLAAWLDDHPAAPASSLIPAVLLLQPALSLSDPLATTIVNDAANAAKFPLLLNVCGPTAPAFQAAERALQTICGRGVPVTMWYWDQDYVLDFTPPVIQRLQATGATCVSLPLSFPSTLDRAFHQHARVADHPVALQAIEAHLASLSP